MKISKFELVFLLVSIWILPLAALAQGSNPLPGSAGFRIPQEMSGEFEVQVQEKGGWIKAGSASYDKYTRAQSINLGLQPAGKDEVTIRILKDGGGKAHLDAVLLGGKAPKKVNGAGEDALRKVSSQDNDLLNYSEGLEITFAPATGNPELLLAARIEPERIPEMPVAFPASNAYRPVDDYSDFYSYQFGSRTGAYQIDGQLEEPADSKPFIKVWTIPGSGHPNGYTYFWVRNDEENLYVAIDSTPDNTDDGDVDYAIVHIKTGTGVKDFKVTVPDNQWGQPGFIYTDKVSYQHKTYEFRIPREELAAASAKTDRIKLAFSIYGTETPQNQSNPNLVYIKADNRYLLCFNNNANYVYCRFLNRGGDPTSGYIQISRYGYKFYQPQIARDNGRNRSLIVWLDSSGTIYGQILKDNGRLFDHNGDESGNTGDNFVIAGNPPPAPPNNPFVAGTVDGNLGPPSVGFDSVNGVYLVVWAQDYNIQGQFLSPAGKKLGSSFLIHSAKDGYGFYPALIYDSELQRFLVAFHLDANLNKQTKVVGQMVRYPEGILTRWFQPGADLFEISSDISSIGQKPQIALDKAGYKLLVVWMSGAGSIVAQSDIAPFPVPDNGVILGQMMSTLGIPLTRDPWLGLDNFVICNNAALQFNPSVAFGNAQQMYLVAWQDDRDHRVPAPAPGYLVTADGAYDIYGQLVDANGNLVLTGSRENFEIISDEQIIKQAALRLTGSLQDPSLAYNSANDVFRVAFSFTELFNSAAEYIYTTRVKSP